MESYVINARRQIHMYPEIGFDLDRTLAFLKGELDKMGVEYTDKYEDRIRVTVEFTISENAGVSLSGTVTSFGDDRDEIMIELIPAGLPESAYYTIITGNTAKYNIVNVAAGTYVVKVSKKNHVTREYTVTVGNSSVIQDVKIHLKGDVDGNGTVTTMDFMRANSHARGVMFLTDYALKCADVVGTDDTVTTMDAMRINAHAKGNNLLW